MMMKQRMIMGLAIGAIVTASLGLTAFAAEKNAVYTVTAKDFAGTEIPVSEWKTDENGIRYFDTEDGVRISIATAEAGDAGYEAMKLERKIDEHGNQYVELEDGSRVYISQSSSASVD